MGGREKFLKPRWGPEKKNVNAIPCTKNRKKGGNKKWGTKILLVLNNKKEQGQQWRVPFVG